MPFWKLRHKTKDERFFILTLFAIAMEAEGKVVDVENTVLNVDLPVGLPPKHYGALFEKFQNYFKYRGKQVFTYKGREYTIKINDVVAFPQDYTVAMTIFPQIQGYNKVVTVDIGGFTLDYLLLRNGSPELSVCDSLEKGAITLYNKISSRANSEYDILLDEPDIDSIIKGEKTDYDTDIVSLVQEMTKTYVDDLLGTLRELGLDLKNGCVVFIGGGALLLREYLEKSGKVGKCILIEDICANAKGYELLYRLKEVFRGRTIVLVSHRIGFAKLADRIVVLKDGKIVEDGSHAELMGSHGEYKRLYDEQVKWYDIGDQL